MTRSPDDREGQIALLGVRVTDHVVQRLEHDEVGGLGMPGRQWSGDVGMEADFRHLGCVERGDVVGQRRFEPRSSTGRVAGRARAVGSRCWRCVGGRPAVRRPARPSCRASFPCAVPRPSALPRPAAGRSRHVGRVPAERVLRRPRPGASGASTATRCPDAGRRPDRRFGRRARPAAPGRLGRRALRGCVC